MTGGAGFLGRTFARYHINKGDDVFSIDDMSSPYAHWDPDMAFREEDVVRWLETASCATETWDIVYHFAAPVGGRQRIESDPLYNADSLRIDSVLFRHAVTHGNFGLIVYPSSSAVYGVSLQTGQGQRLAEEMFHPGRVNWPAPDEMYGFTKMAGEVLAWKYAGYGHNVLCLRPFSGYGEEQSLDYPVPSIAQRAKRREDPLVVWGSGWQARDFIHVDDIVGATMARIKDGISGYQNMNIGSGTPTSFNAVARMMADIVGYEPEIANDDDKPEGVQSRFCDPRRMLECYIPSVSLERGFARVVEAVEA